MSRLKICQVSAEFAPYAKTGGLADVCAALSEYLARNGHDVRVLVPLHRSIRKSDLDIRPVDSLQDLLLQIGPHEVPYSIDRAALPDSTLSIYLLRCPGLFDRDGLYTAGDDEHFRFIVLCRAAIEMCQRMGFAPDVMHVHDWHAALVPVYLKTRYAWDQLFAGTRTVQTIHNIAYQGVVGADRLPDLGIEGGEHELHQDDLHAGRINFLKTGILHADVLTTVSPTYAHEIQSGELGMGLQDLLRARRDTLVGILNGVDYRHWDPRNDKLIPYRYSPGRVAGKKQNKIRLAEELGIDVSDGRPLIGLVSRLTAQKGIELIERVLPRIIETRQVAFAALGSGERRFERFLNALQAKYRDQVCFYQGYSDELAHWIEAGSDMFLMPSRFEPCGLNQMYSLRYGTVPIVHATGGLADTVELYNPETGSGTGIVFRDYNEQGLSWAINAALDLYADTRTWRRIMRNGMHKDFSWERQGAVYVDLYQRILAHGRAVNA